MNFSAISLTSENAIWTLTIQRPQALNALNSQVLSELQEALQMLAGKNLMEARGLVITGSGEKAFVAGADIKEINALSPAQAKEFANRGQKIFRLIEGLKFPVIAAVNGFALGGGLELALACDFIFASENAKLGLPEVSLGLIPGFGGTVRLPRVVGQARAKEIIYSADIYPATAALEFGLVNKVLPLAELLPAAYKMLQTISSRGPGAVAQAKTSIMKAWDLEVDAAMQSEGDCFSSLFTTADFKEGTSAFVEKRKPTFKGN